MADKPTVEQLQQQITLLQEQLNNIKGESNIEIKRYEAEPGFVFKRNRDGMIFGNLLLLGYDYSTGKKRVDKIEFYTQIPDQELDQESD